MKGTEVNSDDCHDSESIDEDYKEHVPERNEKDLNHYPPIIWMIVIGERAFWPVYNYVNVRHKIMTAFLYISIILHARYVMHMQNTVYPIVFVQHFFKITMLRTDFI
jgi:hypothetical protein